MATRIRLRREGRKGQAYFRIVVADSRSPRDGRFVATIGNYNPRAKPAVINVDADEARAWLPKGALPHATGRRRAPSQPIRCARSSRRRASSANGLRRLPRSRAAAQAARPAGGSRGDPPRGESGNGVHAEGSDLRAERDTRGAGRSARDRPAPRVSPRVAAGPRGDHVARDGRTVARSAGGGGRVTMLRINVVTLFPDWFRAPLATSILGRAATATLVQYRVVQLRDYTHDKHQTVDDAPYGGGAGMVLKAEPMVEAVEDLKVVEGPIVLLSARGTLYTHDTAVRYSLGRELTLLCGHYKDVDQRVVDVLGAEEVSIGDFVLSGGEPAALCIVDAVVRLLPGALGDHESAAGDSHYERLLAPPSYTRPPSYRGREVPEVLLSGDHDKIAAWRGAEAERLTRERRPDIWSKHRE